MATREPIHGLILAGGHSRRMGTDKGLLDYHGMPQRDFVFQLLTNYCEKVFTSCRPEQNIPENLNPLFDACGLPGPMNGILSAFNLISDVAWLALAIDMPFVDSAAIGMLVHHRDPSKLATCYFDPDTGQPEPLLTIWEKDSHPALLAFSAAGKISPREFLRTHPVKMIQPPDPGILRNFNYPL